MSVTIGLVGIKLGMSRVFREEGDSIPVTVIQASSNRICQIKSPNKEGYRAIQLAAGQQKPQRLSRALRGHYAKARVPVGRCLREFRVSGERVKELSIGDQLDVRQFVEGQKVDLVGTSKGRGFAGGVKRWNFSTQDATHGNSVSHRHIGSTGQCQFPGKVWRGKKMPGQYGGKRITAIRLEVVAVDEKNQLLLIKGAVPGAQGGRVLVRPAKKQTAVEMARIEKKRIAREKEAQETEKATKAAEEMKESREEQPMPEELRSAKGAETKTGMEAKGAEKKREKTPGAQAKTTAEGAKTEQEEKTAVGMKKTPEARKAAQEGMRAADK